MQKTNRKPFRMDKVVKQTLDLLGVNIEVYFYEMLGW